MLEYFPAPSSQPDTRKRETDPKLIRPQQAITESYLQGTENRKLGSAARDGIKKRRRPARLEEQRTETAATALTWSAPRFFLSAEIYGNFPNFLSIHGVR